MTISIQNLRPKENKHMNFKESVKVCFSVVIMLTVTGFSPLVIAKDEAMICAVTKAIACDKESDCISGSAASINFPLFIRINPENNEIVSVKETGERRVSVIKQITKDTEGRFLIYQGVEPGGAWSTVVDTHTGSMTVTSAAGERDAFVVYGACSRALLKP
jgi:hypothetical protein